MNILTPDKSNILLKKYHLSNHLLIPGLILSYGLNKANFQNKIPENSIHFANIFNFGYHSYVSTSAVISDYVKPVRISQIVRVSNFGLHSLAIIGLCKFVKNYNKSN